MTKRAGHGRRRCERFARGRKDYRQGRGVSPAFPAVCRKSQGFYCPIYYPNGRSSRSRKGWGSETPLGGSAQAVARPGDRASRSHNAQHGGPGGSSRRQGPPLAVRRAGEAVERLEASALGKRGRVRVGHDRQGHLRRSQASPSHTPWLRDGHRPRRLMTPSVQAPSDPTFGGWRRRRADYVNVFERIGGKPCPQLVARKAPRQVKTHPRALHSILHRVNRASHGSDSCALLHGNAPSLRMPVPSRHR